MGYEGGEERGEWVSFAGVGGVDWIWWRVPTGDSIDEGVGSGHGHCGKIDVDEGSSQLGSAEL